MQKLKQGWMGVMGGLGGAAGVLVSSWGMASFLSGAEPPTKPVPAVAAEAPPSSGSEAERALARTRKQVRMLDDIYKGAIVTITDNYVNDKDMIPAGTAFKKIFAAVEEKGWHRVRLVDASGEPYNAENVAVDEFEKQAIQQLLAGKPWVEEVEGTGAEAKLRVATPIPVVFDKCIMCHANYEGTPAGRPIGALIYRVPIE